MIKSRFLRIFHLVKPGNCRTRASLILIVLTLIPCSTMLCAAMAEDAADVSKALSEEARRQHTVCQRMDDLIVRFQEIIVDLVSNELLEEAKGKQLSDTVAILRGLNVNNVPKAAKFLEDALIRLETLQSNLEAADREIQIILNELEKLIEDSSIANLANELEEIIQSEKQLHSDTREWKEEISKSPQEARSQSRRFAEQQNQIAERVENFQKALAESTQNAAADPLRGLNLQRAQNTLQQKEPGGLLRGAAREIGNANPDPAVQKQQAALTALEEAKRQLEQNELDALGEMHRDFRDKLEELLRDQTELRQDTEKVPSGSFQQQKQNLLKQQKELGNRLNRMANFGLPPVSPPELPDLLQNARQDAEQAAQRMSSNQKQPAVQSQKKAEENLQSAVDLMDRQLAAMQGNPPDLEDLAQKAEELSERQDNLRKETNQTPRESLSQRTPQQNDLQKQAKDLSQQAPIPQFQQSAQQMQQASQALQQNQKKEAMQNQQEAAQLMKEGAQVLRAAQNMPQQGMEDLAQKAQELSQKQSNLQNQTGQTPGKSLPQLAPQQDSLQQQAEGLSQQAPMPQFQQSAQQMQQASQALQQGQGQQAMQHQQEAAQSLMAGAQALMAAQNASSLMSQQQQLMNQTAQAGQQALPGLGQMQGSLGQQAQSMNFPQAAQQMAMAGQALGQGQRNQAMQHQQNAMNSLMKQMNQMGMGDMMSMMRFRLYGRSALTTMPVQGSGLNETAYRYFDQKPGGTRPGGDANWNPLPPRELKAFYQNYAHELPVEYRKLLEEYYETLSE